jgi:protoheme IX farnesyltransferase
MPEGPPATPAPREGNLVWYWVRMLLVLVKARITFAVTFSVATGFVLFQGRFSTELILPMAGVFLLACGSAALNQVQEWRTDLRMERTRNRPIPSGQLQPRWALFIACLFMVAGINLLANVERHTYLVVALGAFSVFWYNLVYWWLKRATAFAVVPGALLGAVPPVIGWCAAGGEPLDPKILQVGLFFIIWQIPHFWLLLHLFGTEYTGADLPSPTAMLSRDQFRRITFAWVFPTAASGLVLMTTFQLHMPWNLLVLAGSIWVTLQAFGYLKRPPSRATARSLFNRLNLYALCMMLLLMASALFG